MEVEVREFLLKLPEVLQEEGLTQCTHSQVMIHQPLGGVQGQATEIEIHAREILRMRKELNGILSKHTGQPIDVIQKDTERDNFMTAEEAKAYGLIDEILTRPLPDETK